MVLLLSLVSAASPTSAAFASQSPPSRRAKEQVRCPVALPHRFHLTDWSVNQPSSKHLFDCRVSGHRRWRGGAGALRPRLSADKASLCVPFVTQRAVRGRRVSIVPVKVVLPDDS